MIVMSFVDRCLREKWLNLKKMVNCVGSELHASSCHFRVFFADQHALSK